MVLSALKKIFLDPFVALCVFILFLTGYIVYIGFEGGFSEKFLHFGPGTTPDNTTQFLAIKLDSWEKVGTIYAISFLTAFVTTYYQMAVNNNLHSYIWNRAVKVIPYSKIGTLIILFTEPIMYEILGVIGFFTTLTMQLQFLIPGLLGSFVAFIPGVLGRLEGKKFDPFAEK